MDLSTLIFVAVALAWACYLIPTALKHHDEVAGERLEESHSTRVRILSRRRPPVAEPVAEPVVEPARPALSDAGRAARRRRRVLAVLLLTLAVTWVLTWFAYLPSITPLWPSIAVVGWLVLARVSVVRMQQARRIARRAPYVEQRVAPVEQAAPVERPVEAAQPTTPRTASEMHRLSFDARPEVVAEAEALADDGSLWDPLPLTLPTYVGKATARRTVRTIELTGMTSSGHDDADSALAREAEAAEAAEVASQVEQEQRRVAGA